MFGLGKPKVPIDKVAAGMAKAALMALEDPSKQDVSFQEQASRAGVDKKRFTLEAIALQSYAMASAINRERLEGRLDQEQATLLTQKFLHSIL
jgi:hypothetical protein